LGTEVANRCDKFWRNRTDRINRDRFKRNVARSQRPAIDSRESEFDAVGANQSVLVQVYEIDAGE